MGESYIRSGILAETLCHEASHTSLDRPHAGDKDWLAAQKKDPEFISGYAKSYPRREDVAETYLMYFAVRYKPERISKKLRNTIQNAVPNRIKYFDSLKVSMHPVVKSKWDGSDAKTPPPVTLDDLKKKIGKVAYVDVPLSEIFQQLEDTSKVNTSVHWLYMKSAGVDRKTKISIKLAAATLEKVLTSVLEKAAPGKLGFEIRKGVLVISSRRAIDAQKQPKKQKKTTPKNK